MPPTKESYSDFIARMAQQFKGIFAVDKSVLFCTVCEVPVTAKVLSGVKQHLATAGHQKKANTPSTSIQKLVSQFSDPHKPGPKLNPICMDICELFMDVDIPLHKLRHPSMQRFLEKYTKTSPSESAIRQNYVPVKYESCIETLRAKAAGKHIWVSMDETTDVEARLVVNFVFGILNDEAERDKCYLLDLRQVQANDSNNMAIFFNDCMSLLFPEGKSFVFFITFELNRNCLCVFARQEFHTKTFCLY